MVLIRDILSKLKISLEQHNTNIVKQLKVGALGVCTLSHNRFNRCAKNEASSSDFDDLISVDTSITSPDNKHLIYNNRIDNTTHYNQPVKFTNDQWLYKATEADIELFKKSKIFPSRPIDLENSIVIRLVDLNNEVVSPVGSSIFYSEYGIRNGEFRRFLCLGIFVCGILISLGYWQLRRRKWKMELLSMRHTSLDLPKLNINTFSDINKILSSNGTKDGECILYRPVEATGVLDTNYPFLIGPRKSLKELNGNTMGYYVLYPLRFMDGSVALVNMGWLRGSSVFNMNISPEWITVRGILTDGETHDKQFSKMYILSSLESFFANTLKYHINLTNSLNRPSYITRDSSIKVYKYLDPSAIGVNVSSKSPSNTKKYIINVYDSLFEEDKVEIAANIKSNNPYNRENAYFPKSKIGTQINEKYSVKGYHFERKQKSDYLLFYADPDTHLNYAIQWFLMASSIGLMCIYKYIRINNILKI